MQITGRDHLSVDPATAWAAFHDAGVLERSLPGAQSLRQVGPGRYDMTVSAGVAAIRGTYDGQAAFSEEKEPESFVLSLSGAGGPGTVRADVHVRLAPAPNGGTDLDWTADAVVGGAVGGVGQRMLSSVARRLASQFFSNIDRDLAPGDAPTSPALPGGSAVAGAGSRQLPGQPASRAVQAAGSNPVVQMVTGAAIALVGVALGARLRRR